MNNRLKYKSFNVGNLIEIKEHQSLFKAMVLFQVLMSVKARLYFYFFDPNAAGSLLFSLLSALPVRSSIVTLLSWGIGFQSTFLNRAIYWVYLPMISKVGQTNV